jgi:hypothetical protein
MRTVTLVTLAAVLLGGCGDSTTEPEPVIPPDIRVVTASRGPLTGSTVTATLENRGGPGAFTMELWGWSSYTPCIFDAGRELCPTPILLGQTDAVDVAAGWSESATWTLTGSWYVRRLVVLTRNPGSIQYRETDRYEIR